MSREIKFRVWDLQREYFSSEYDIYCSNGCVTCNGRGIVDAIRQRFVPQQYTGLKDKNGVEIYEGDIIYVQPRDEQSGWCKPVYYENTSYKFNTWDLYSFFEDNTPVEVIGNIFENPELLKQ